MLDGAGALRRYLRLLHEKATPEAILQAFNEYQLLCALREGPFAGLNDRIEQAMQQRKIQRHPHSRWYEGASGNDCAQR